MLLVLFCACLSIFLTGIIWFMQIVHYPLFKYQSNIAFHKENQKRSAFLIFPLMAIEFVLSLVLLIITIHTHLFMTILIINILLWLILISTFLLQAPCHVKLKRHADQSHIIANLVLTNWIRTFLITIKSILWIIAIGYAMQMLMHEVAFFNIFANKS